jgi:hypothetical protein
MEEPRDDSAIWNRDIGRNGWCEMSLAFLVCLGFVADGWGKQHTAQWVIGLIGMAGLPALRLVLGGLDKRR